MRKIALEEHFMTDEMMQYLNSTGTTDGNVDKELAGHIGPEALGEDGVMFPVDYPYEDSKSTGQWLDAAPLDNAVREKVAHGNAARLLRLQA